jgi:O-antigen ligase/tetratricopeptide (TPR) repeat protein
MPLRLQFDRVAAIAIEGLVLLMVCLAPWAFGSVEPPHEFLLEAGTALIAALWGVRMVLQGQLTWKKCPVALCLAALCLLAFWQIQPLPRSVLKFLSPSAVRLYDEMLPAEPERLPNGEVHSRPPLAAGSSLSLYPGATRRELIRLLAVFVLFTAVRNNIASTASLRRLSIALVINGALLAFFAIVQFFTSEPNTIYWSVSTRGLVFGPFVCRTHFPFYLNACIGAGLGLLLSRASAVDDDAPGSWSDTWAGVREAGQSLLADPASLWLVCALVLMVASVVLSLSRGGLLALVGAAAVVVLLRPVQAARFARLVPAVLCALLALGLVAWLGFSQVEARVTSVVSGEALQQSRLPIWEDCLPFLREFPLLGTGFGTFVYVEPLHRHHMPPQYIVDHAHNEYLEALVEGGVIRLGITLLAVGLVCWFGYRAVRRRNQPLSGLALGTLFGLAAIALHSFGDFAIHLPAIALLTTVLAAQLVSAGGEKPSTEPADDSYVLRGFGVAPIVGMVAALSLAFALAREGWDRAVAHGYRLQAAALAGKTDPDDKQRRIALLEAAAARMPLFVPVVSDLADLRVEHFAQRQLELERGGKAVEAARWVLRGAAVAPLAPFATFPSSVAGVRLDAWHAATGAVQAELAYGGEAVEAARWVLCGAPVLPLGAFTTLPGSGLNAWQSATVAIQAELARGGRALEAARWVLRGAPVLPLGPLATLPSSVPNAGFDAWSSASAAAQAENERENLHKGLAAYLWARDLCPYFAKPQVYLAGNSLRLAQADPAADYRRRAKRIVPNAPDLWYMFGTMELLTGQAKEAAQSWRRSLELADTHLSAILTLGQAPAMGPQVLLNEVLPDKAEMLVTAAAFLFPNPDDRAARRPFMEKALNALRASQAPRTPEQFALEAQLLHALGRSDDALAAYQRALVRLPRNWELRLELAALLIERKEYDDARLELIEVLHLQPGQPKALDLLNKIERQLWK